MSENDLGNVLKSINAALEIYVRRQGSLTAADIHAKSMLTALQSQVAAQLKQARSSLENNAQDLQAQAIPLV